MANPNLRNEDFRKLLAATPRRSGTEAPKTGEATHSFKHKHVKPQKKVFKPKKPAAEDEEDNAALKAIMKNYRDRAAERRAKGGIDDFDVAEKLTSAYQAVPGDSRRSSDKPHSRKQAIEESKYLGGDMEHTHLVKGLDYSLLNKVRSEINKLQAEEEAEEGLEKAYAEAESSKSAEAKTEMKMAKNIQSILFKTELPMKNEHFAKGRMAYVVNMEEDEETDIPTTLLRSLQECPKTESNANINANNMLISKLTQVLSYLRADHKKKKKIDLTEEEVKANKDNNIFDDESEYIPSKEREKSRRDDRDRDRDRERDRRRSSPKRGNYFDDKDRRDRDRRDDRDRRSGRDTRDKEREERREKEKQQQREKEQEEREKKLEEKFARRRKEAESGGYDECYPGGLAELGGVWGDSDDEDFSKMDQGSKKSIVKRWDFDNEEDFEKYQNGREANPKAAYQFGLKPTEGRKTRKSVDVNKKLDRELNQISQINEKRKADIEAGTYKKPKY